MKLKHMQIMIVEDDKILANEIRNFLIRWGYMVTLAKNFEDIPSDFVKYHPQLILMDINLPYYDGFYWCNKIRTVSTVPIMYISSRSDDKDKIMAIAQGGDDFVEKPFHLDVLKAKIEAILRRTYQYQVNERIYLRDDLFYDKGSNVLYFHHQQLEFTKSEKRIMLELLEHRDGVVTREELMMALWNTDEYVSDGTLSVLISRLRSKLIQFCNEEIIHTRKGLGYYIECAM